MSDDRRNPGDVSARLERLAQGAVDVSDERLEAISARVRESLANDDGDRVGVVPITNAESVKRPSSVVRLAAIAASIVILIVVSVALFGSSDRPLVIASADGVTVVSPDGGSAVAESGTELFDGAVLDVTGFVEIGERRYGPGRYRIRDGRVELVPDVDVGGTEEVLTPATTVEAPTPSPEPTNRPTVPTSPSAATPTTEPASPPATSPRPTEPAPTRTTLPDPDVPRTTASDRGVPTTPTPTRPPATETTSPAERPTTTTSSVRPSTTTPGSTTSTTDAQRRSPNDDAGER